MARRVELYFKSESNAESMRSKLQTQKVNNISVEEIPDVTDSDTGIFVANNPDYIGGAAGSATTNTGVTQPMTYTGTDLDEKSEYGDGPINHLLTFEVSEENYPDVLIAIKDLDFYYQQEE